MVSQVWLGLRNISLKSKSNGKCGFVESEGCYDTYEEALEEGLKKALKLI